MNNQAQAEGHVIDTTTGEVHAVGLSDGHRAYASWCHWAPMIAWISVAASSGISFFVPPLVALAMWQIKKDESPFIDDQGKEALNFHISLILLWLILIPVTLITCLFGAILYVGIPILALVGGIMGGVRSARGVYYRYPMCIRMI